MVANTISQSKEDDQLGRGSPQETWFLDKIKALTTHKVYFFYQNSTSLHSWIVTSL
jgi:hypothetical protein